MTTQVTAKMITGLIPEKAFDPPYVEFDMKLRFSSILASIAPAFVKMQGTIRHADKSSQNPHFRSRYADLAEVWNVAREPLAMNGLCIIQSPSARGTEVTVTTFILHMSGEWIMGELTMTADKTTPQAIGSCITYARRYSLMAFLGIAPADEDDGNAASGIKPTQQQSAPAQKKFDAREAIDVALKKPDETMNDEKLQRQDEFLRKRGIPDEGLAEARERVKGKPKEEVGAIVAQFAVEYAARKKQ